MVKKSFLRRSLSILIVMMLVVSYVNPLQTMYADDDLGEERHTVEEHNNHIAPDGTKYTCTYFPESRVLSCDKAEHEHRGECYENKVCNQHVHTSNCRLVCTHEHTLYCFLICCFHIFHSDACLKYSCGYPDHTHSDACQGKELICAIEVHKHSDSCYKVEEAYYMCVLEKLYYYVTYAPGTQGTFEAQTTNNLEYGKARPAAPKVTGNPGYKFNGWDPELTDNVVNNVTYIAQWVEDDNIEIKYEAGVGGTVSINSEALPPITGNATGSTAVANPGYKFVNWTKDGVEVSKELHYTPAKVDGLNEAATYVANFEKDITQWHTVTFVAGANGSLTGTTGYIDILTGTAWNDVVSSLPEAIPAIGYEFDAWTPDIPAATDKINENLVFIANFKAADTKYTVEHYLQNVSDDEYTLDTSVEKTGKTGVLTEAEANTYTGFTLVGAIEQVNIAADGSTVVKLYYNRNMYELTYSITGEYFAEAEYNKTSYRYGAEIVKLDAPSRAGYTFSGWSAIPDTMPADNVVVTGSYSRVIIIIPEEEDTEDEEIEDEEPVVIEEEEIPAGPAPVEEAVEIEEEEIPAGAVPTEEPANTEMLEVEEEQVPGGELPYTAGITAEVYYSLGGLSILLGSLIKRRKK